jgi:hypothetical protein
MQKINETVFKSQFIFRNNEAEAAHESTVPENLEGEDSKLIEMLKNKVQEMKIPLHELHRRDKLSTVMEESQCQSGRTLYEMRSPREPDQEARHKDKDLNDQTLFEMYSFIRESQAEPKPQEDFQNGPKKITDIRKTSYDKDFATEVAKLQERPSKPKLPKERNINHLRCPKVNDAVLSHKKSMPEMENEVSNKWEEHRRSSEMSNQK